jgi:hypothetical protein
MYVQSGEPTLDEMLSAPTVVSMMKGDGVDPDNLRTLLRDMSRRLTCPRVLRRSSVPQTPRSATRHAMRQHHPG